MAESDDLSRSPRPSEAAGGRGEAQWPLAAVAATALLAFCGLALGLVLLLGRHDSAGQSVQVNPVININPTGAATPGPAMTPAGPRRGEPQRDAAQNLQAVALPGTLGPALRQRASNVVRASTQAPPSPPFPAFSTGGPRVYLRVRSVGGGPWDGSHALPMPIRQGIAEGAQVRPVYAVRQEGAGPVAAVADQPYADSSASQGDWDLRLSGVRKTVVLGGYRAPAGFLFLTARLVAHDQGSRPLALDQERFEVRDSDGVRYLCVPELDAGFPQGPLAAGASADLTLSFLVPAGAELKALALLTQGSAVLLPLTRS